MLVEGLALRHVQILVTEAIVWASEWEGQDSKRKYFKGTWASRTQWLQGVQYALIHTLVYMHAVSVNMACQASYRELPFSINFL